MKTVEQIYPEWEKYYTTESDFDSDPLRFPDYCAIYYGVSPDKAEQYYRSLFKGLANV